jgi:Tol biopolymer transport system component/DNA-binding winged helix-turn-helix (wHTH) protein
MSQPQGQDHNTGGTGPDASADVYAFGPCRLDVARRLVSRDGRALSLAPKTFDLLLILVRSGGRVLTRQELIDALWPDTFVEEANLSFQISALRKALGDSSAVAGAEADGASQWIETVPKVGYRFTASVLRPLVQQAVTGDGPPPAASSDAQLVTESAWWHRGLALTTVVACIAIGAALFVGARWQAPPPPRSAAPSIEDLQITPLTSTGKAEAPAISPDGRYVAYAQRERKARDMASLWIRHIDTANQAQILLPEEPGIIITGATVTPDGGFVDFTRASRTVVGQELWRIPFLGGRPRKLLDGRVSNVGWSPDGRHMAFVRELDRSHSISALVVADPDGSHERQVAVRKPTASFMVDRGRPAWSPDGRVVAVFGADSSGGPATSQVVAVNVSTGVERILPVRLQVTGVGPAWLDPGSIVLSGSIEAGAPSQLWRLSYPEGELSRLTNDLSNYSGVSVTADRRSLVTGRAETSAGVWVGDTSGTRGTELVPLSPANELRGLAWAGERLLHVVSANGHTSIAAMATRSGVDEVLTRGLSPTATSDGRAVVFISAELGDKAGLWKVDDDGRGAVQLVAGDARWPVITRDDRRVIFVSSRSGKQRMWSVPIEGGQAVPLGDMFAYVPDVSPDGTSLLFGASPTTRGDLAICDLPDCTNVRAVKTPEGGLFSRWTPDGKGIAFIYLGGGGNLWVQPLDGSPQRQLTHFTDDRVIMDFRWSRDGTRLAVSRATGTDDIVLFKGLRP